MLDPASLISVVTWSLAYILIIRRNYLDKTCGMPFLALAANVSWEFLHATFFPFTGIAIVTDSLWLLLDLVIVWQYLLYTPANARIQKGLLLAAAIAVFLPLVAVARPYPDQSFIVEVFGQNLMMSVLFVWVLLQKKSSSGQSLYIALSKAVGTDILILAGWDLLTLHSSSVLTIIILCGIMVFDPLYILLIYRQLLKEKVNPLLRL